MRIALLHPTYWPEAHRGSERLIHDLGTTLAANGHEVTLLTSHRHRPTSSVEDGIRVVRSWRAPQPPTFGLHEHFLGNVHNVAWRLGRGRFDLAQAFFPSDAWAAVRARRLGGPPVILSYHGIPLRQYLVARRNRLEMLRFAVDGAAACTVLSEAAAQPFRRYLLREPRILPGGVLRDRFAVDEPRSPQPTLICAASVGDPRKRGELLIAAFAELRRRRPEIRMRVVRTPDPELSPCSVELPEGAEWIDAEDTETLARAYAGAWASILPSVDEPFGLVLIESLAAGTPVVAARSGACPEIVTERSTGRLFEPDDVADAARAISEALELGAAAGTVAACREQAANWDWSRVVGLYERLYDEVVRDPVAVN